MHTVVHNQNIIMQELFGILLDIFYGFVWSITKENDIEQGSSTG